ncbi:hypothetical protein [Paenibacillus luteus]|uniref:hypothetical protein n=1 Tax=Paenibacillus luteus TaxID=2545753 RepID=UPI0011419999|nr:hypothetical protein [Paenibacillus luteus]
MNEALPNSNYHFIAMEYYSLILNRTFLISVFENMICGAKVHGIISSEPTDKSHPAHIFTVKGNLYDPTVYIDKKYLNKLNGIDFQSEAFLYLNKSNFQIRKHEIQTIQYNPKKMGNGKLPA